MNLKPLLLITLSALLVIILGVVFMINLKSMQSFIEHQLYSSSQDSAYSLGLSLAPIELNDQEDIILRIDAIFDSGYYNYITYYDTNNKIIYSKSMPIVIKDTPQWFIELLPLKIEEATAEVSNGWNIIGTLHIKGHMGYAYYELYKSFKELLITFSFVALFSFLALLVIINTLLSSLKKIRLQANGINEHKFIIEKSRPFISEFDLLIQSMNQMVGKVEGIFNSEAKTYQHYQTLLYKDEETLLPNKKYFMLKLKEILDDERSNIGYIAIISIKGLEDIKKSLGFQAYKAQLQSFLDSIPKTLSEHNLLARISTHEIAVLFNTHDIQKIAQHFNNLQDALSITNKDISSKENLLCYSVGVAPYFEDDQISEALSRVDYSLSRSKINGCNIIDIYDADEHSNKLITMGKNSWKDRFDAIFLENRIRLAMQSALEITTKKVFHKEALIRIKEDDGSLLTAGYYLPMANALGLVAKFDKSVIEMVLSDLANTPTPTAINISKDFILKSTYFLELRSTLSSVRESYPALVHFEASENDILEEFDAFVEFSDMVHAHKQKFGIDRFSGIKDISYIEKLRPDYIKININFILESLKNNSAILNTLNILSKTMGITLIVTSVQTQSQLEKILEIDYKIAQGLIISDITTR